MNEINRPLPSPAFVAEFAPYIRLIPADGLWQWVQEQIIADSGHLHNPDHSHLADADIAFLWAATAFTKKGRTVLGQAEEVMMRAGGWQKARMEQQMYEWFTGKPVSGNNKGSMLIIWRPYPRTHCHFATVDRDELMAFGAKLLARREAA